jgi:hypothetical protein
MAGRRVLFIPRPRAVAMLKDSDGGPSLVARATSWSPHITNKGHSFDVYCLDDDTYPLLKSTDTLYIYGGHGITARNFIGWPGNNGNPLQYDAVATIIQGVIPPGFAGKVKVYSCHSGDGGGLAFAKLFADEMRTAGYNSCAFYGYQGEVTQIYEEVKGIKAIQYRGKTGQDPDPGFHKWSVGQGRMRQGRAKDFRLIV